VGSRRERFGARAGRGGRRWRSGVVVGGRGGQGIGRVGFVGGERVGRGSRIAETSFGRLDVVVGGDFADVIGSGVVGTPLEIVRFLGGVRRLVVFVRDSRFLEGI
jgi:hypothetical protein